MNPTARMEISVYPLGTGNPSVSEEVSAVFDILDKCGLPYEISVMGTTIEGEPGELFSLAQRLHKVVFSDT
ncbi:MAG: thiamine-binding protein, partial [Candidatus Latescibacteria bacterium]|nr:thiamine-binding protein [Candidatus Latescibacterota bacterium]